jgi:1,4-dihydroxy-2-naphthoate polyprenyltransferase
VNPEREGGPPAADGIRPLAAWVLAIRPRTLPAAAAPVVLATGMAASRGSMSTAPAMAAMLGALLIQIATNLANDYFDAEKGADHEGRLGPVRVVQSGLLPAGAVLRATWLVLGLATLVGGYLVWVGGWPILVIGLFSLALAVAYTGGPFPLAYHGLGDVFVFIFFGLVAVGGSYWVQALELPPDVLLAGAGVGALSTAILVVNNLRDLTTDERSGKRTLAVRLGETGSRLEYLLLVGLGATVPVAGVIVYDWTAWTLLAWMGLLPLLRTAANVLTYHDPRELNPALAETARGVALYAGFMAIGFLLGGVVLTGGEVLPSGEVLPDAGLPSIE